jgi:hypothetical protein
MLGSNVNNIRFNGSGRVYMGAVAGSSMYEIGELESLTFGMSVSTEKLSSNRNASRATILEVESEREANINLGLRELSEENLQVAFLGGTINADNQAASYADQVVPTYVNDQYVDLGHLNVFVTKITGVITGTVAVGDTVTGDSSGVTAKVAFVGANYLILVNVSSFDDIESGEQLEALADTNYITATSIEKLEDVCITSVAEDELRVQGTDYDLDPDYGYLRKDSTGDIVATDVVSYDYEAVSRKYIHGLSSGSVEKKIVIVTDKDDTGPRQRYTFHKVKLVMNGDMPLIGDGVAAPTLQGSVLSDSTQSSGQEYFKCEMM